MIENKRFYLDENGINDREYEFSILGEDELVDIINELNDENEQLKQELATFYEVWYEFYDGTQANLRGYHKRIKTFTNKDKAVNERDRLNAEVEYENPYYIKEVVLDD